MITLGVICLVVGYLAKIHPLVIVGWVLVVLGLLIWILGAPVY